MGDSGEALERFAETLYFDREYAAAAVQYERTFAWHAKAHDVVAAGRAARTVAWIRGNVLGDWAIRSGWLARARSVYEEAGEDRPEQGWVHVIGAFSEPDAAERESLLLAAARIGRQFGDPDLEYLAKGYLGSLLLMVDRVEEGMALSDEALAAVCAGELTDLATIDEIFCGLLWACELVNDVERADQWMRAAAERLARSNVVGAFCHAHYGGILTLAGRWAEAESELLESARHFDRGMAPRRAAALVRLADLRVRQGRLDEAGQLLAGLDHHPDAVRPLAALFLARGEAARARDLLERATRVPDDEVPTVGVSTTLGTLLALLVEAALAQGDPRAAAGAADRLDAVAAAQRGPYLRAASALARGRVSAAVGDGDAAAFLHDALRGFAVAGLPVEVAQTRLELARALAGESPDLAVAEARAALEDFERLAAARRADETAALLRALGAPARTGPKGLDTLTRRETEVLGLVGAGLSNTEIGDRLFITRKTVEHHVGSVLAKLGLRNRAEAAAYATRMNLRR